MMMMRRRRRRRRRRKKIGSDHRVTVKISGDREQLLASLGHGTVLFTWHSHDHRESVSSGQSLQLFLSAPWSHSVIHLFILSSLRKLRK